MDAALGLGALARVVDQEGVDQREVAEGGVGAAGGGQARVLAGQPLQVAVLAQVDHRVGAEAAVVGAGRDPAVGGQVVVRGRQIGVVVDRDRVLAEAARRLDEDQQVAAAQGGEDDVALRVAAAVDEHLAGRPGPSAPRRRSRSSCGQRGVPAAVVGRRDTDRVAGQLLLGEPVLVVAARLDEGADQLVAVAGGQAGDVGVRAEVVALRAQPAQQGDRAGGGVQADRVADAGVLGRVRGQDEREALVGGRDVAQPGVAYGDSGDPGGALGVGDVGGQAVLVDLLEGERDGDQTAVELGHGDLAGGVQRGDALVVLLPGGCASRSGTAPGGSARRGRSSAPASQDSSSPPADASAGLVPPAARTVVTMASAAPQRVDQLGLGGAQRGDVQRERPAAGVLDRARTGRRRRRCCRSCGGRGSRARRRSGRRSPRARCAPAGPRWARGRAARSRGR